jgi:MFS family permease
MGAGGFMLLFPWYIARAGGGPWLIGAFVAALLLPFFLLSPSIGRLERRLGAATLVTCGALTVAAGTVALLLVVPGSWLVVPIRLLQGVGHVLLLSTCFALVVRALPAQGRAQGLGVFTFFVQASAAVGVLLAALVSQHASLEIFLLLASVLTLLVIPVAMGLPAAPSGAVARSQTGSAASRPVLALWRLITLFCLLAVAFGCTLQLAAAYAADRSAQASVAGLLVGLLLGSGIGRLLIGRALALFRTERAMMLVCSSMICAGLALIGLMPLMPLMALAGTAVGLAYGLLMPSLTAQAVKSFPSESYGYAGTLMLGLSELGLRGGPLLMAPIAASIGYSGVFLVLSALVPAAALLMGLNGRGLPRAQGQSAADSAEATEAARGV